MKRLLIWGAGDQGTVTLDCAAAMDAYRQIDFLDIAERGSREIPGYRIYREAEEDLRRLLEGYDEAIVATGDNLLRETKIALLAAIGIPLAILIHPAAAVSPSAQIAGGSAVFANASVSRGAHVGMGCIVNTGAVVEHDCVLQDYVNLCPAVALAGRVGIGRRTFLGIGSTVIDGVVIGDDVTIGAGAVVIGNIPSRRVAVGVPARVIRETCASGAAEAGSLPKKEDEKGRPGWAD